MEELWVSLGVVVAVFIALFIFGIKKIKNLERKISKRISIQYSLLNEAQSPTYATDSSVGMDLYSNKENFRLSPGERRFVGTGVFLSVPAGYEGQIRPRADWAGQYGITILNTPGSIDQNVKREIRVLLFNAGKKVITITRGARIARIVFVSVVKASLNLVSGLNQEEQEK
jgi:dUTP pyrophosphatase